MRMLLRIVFGLAVLLIVRDVRVPMALRVRTQELNRVDLRPSRPPMPRESGWRISLESDVNLNVDVDFPPELSHDQRVAQGLSTAGFHLINAAPLVCEAPEPGLKTYLDLPMITGCLGADEAARP